MELPKAEVEAKAEAECAGQNKAIKIKQAKKQVNQSTTHDVFMYLIHTKLNKNQFKKTSKKQSIPKSNQFIRQSSNQITSSPNLFLLKTSSETAQSDCSLSFRLEWSPQV